MDSDKFSSMDSDDTNMKLVANKSDHKNHIDEAFLLAIKNANNVVIVTKNNDEIIANKKVLSIFSSLLRSLFQDSESLIHLPDCSSSSVQHVLNIVTNSFTNMDTDSLDDLNDIIETARVMDIDISNIYVEQSMSTSQDGSSLASGFVTPSRQRHPPSGHSTDKSGNTTRTLSSLHTSDLNGTDLWWLSGFSAVTLHGQQIQATYDLPDTNSPSQVSGFLNQQPKNKERDMKHNEKEGVDTDRVVQGVQVINDTESTSRSVLSLCGEVIKPVSLSGSESVEVAKSKVTPTPGFCNVEPPSKSEHFAPEHNSTKLNGTPTNYCSSLSRKSDNLKVVRNEPRRGTNRKQNVQERLIVIPKPSKQIGKSTRGNGRSRNPTGNPEQWREARGGRGLNQEGRPIPGEVSEASRGGGRGLNKEERPRPELLSGASRGTGQSSLRTGRRNVLSVGTIMKFLDQSDDECVN